MLKKIILLLMAFSSSQYVYAEGGVALGATRVVYPIDSNQVLLKIANSDKENNYLVQTWITDVNNNKSKDFVVTPPLFNIKKDTDNTLRIVYTGDKNKLAKDRETLFYLISKVIPSSKQEDKDKNMLYLASTSRIKIFLRPTSLNKSGESIKSLKSLKCSLSSGQIKLENPTPYYLNITTIKTNSGHMISKAETIEPFSSNVIKTSAKGNSLTYSAINDYGAVVRDNVCSF